MPGHGARVRYSLGTNVKTLFFLVPELEFGHGAGARVQGRDLVLGHKSGHRVPVCTPLFSSVAVQGFVIVAKLMFFKKWRLTGRNGVTLYAVAYRVNATPFCAGTQALVPGFQVWTAPQIINMPITNKFILVLLIL